MSFPRTASATLGQGFVEKMYAELLSDPHCVGYVALAHGKVCGFIFGGTDWPSIQQRLWLIQREWLLLHPLWIWRLGIRLGVSRMISLARKAHSGHGRPIPSASRMVEIGAAEGRVWVIAVAAERKGEGLAQMLMQRAIQEFRQRGCGRAWLTVDTRNLRAIRFYERLGWVMDSVKSDGLIYGKVLQN
jgi:ribosomal protein S18 acetylase RimI-like enzyme